MMSQLALSNSFLSMNSPLESLYGSITHTFENPNGSAIDSLQSVVDIGLINPEIHVDDVKCDENYSAVNITRASTSTPAVIRLDIKYLQGLWGFIYGWFVIYEEGIMKPWIRGDFNGEIEYHSPLINRARKLLEHNWQDDISWPTNLPSPVSFHPKEEKFYSEKANQIFINSVAFLLYHEFAHAKQGHLDDQKSIKDKSEKKELEREADEFAFSALIAQTDDEQHRRIKGWSVLAPVLMALSNAVRVSTLFPETHPFVHHRVDEVLKRLNFKDVANQDYFTFLCMTFASIVFNRMTQKAEQITFYEAKEGLTFYLDELDKMRQK